MAFGKAETMASLLAVDRAGERLGETPHFWYRMPPPGIFIDSQRGNYAFGYEDGAVMLSEDNGHTWPHRARFAAASDITFSHVLRNGNVLFAANAALYLSEDRLKTYRQVIVKNPDGSDYVPHTPQNAERPGWYFHTLPGEVSFDVRGKEMMVWGNYCNVVGGATPVNIYYSTDSGRTVKIAYSFGQNPSRRDDGSKGGGKTGALLGNPDSPVVCRHVHTVAYNPAEDAYYACTGDFDDHGAHECHWMRGAYDAEADTWAWRVLISASPNARYKAGGISFVNGKCYWISDSNVVPPYDRGVFRCDPADITRPEKHTLLFNPEVESGSMIIDDDVILASHCAPASPMACGLIISTDMGRTWAQYDLKELGRRSPTRLHARNGEGWFRMDLRTGWIDRSPDVLFLKPKPAAITPK